MFLQLSEELKLITLKIQCKMENWEREIKENILRKALAIETEFDTPVEIVKGGEGSKGGKIIGHTRSGKPIYEHFHAKEYKGFNKQDHFDAADAHDEKAKKAYNVGDWGTHSRHIAKSSGHLSAGHLVARGELKSMRKAEEDELTKASSGIYKDTPDNRKHGRVGERYGNMVHGGKVYDLENGGKKKSFYDLEKEVKPVITITSLTDLSSKKERLKEAVKDYIKKWEDLYHTNKDDEFNTINGGVLAQFVDYSKIPGKYKEVRLPVVKFMNNLLTELVKDKTLRRHTEAGRGWVNKKGTIPNSIQKAIAEGIIPDSVLEKARSGTYKPTKDNIKQGRAGERYGAAVHGGQTQSIEETYSDAPNWKDYKKINADPNDGRNARNVWQQDLYEYAREKLMKQSGKNPSEHEATDLYDKLWKRADERAWKDAQADDARITHGELIKEGKEKKNPDFKEESPRTRTDSHFKEAFDSYAPKKEKAVEDTLQKALDSGLISAETFEKARSGIYAPTGENKKKGVVGQKYGSKKPEEPAKGEKPKEGAEPQMDEKQLAEHATQSSEQALSNAIKQSPDPTVRQVAHAELQRRQKEEKPMADKDKDTFPKKESKNSDNSRGFGGGDTGTEDSGTGKEQDAEYAKKFDKHEDKLKDHDGALKEHEKKLKELEKQKEVKKSIQGIKYF